jgi:hypothetical protein
MEGLPAQSPPRSADRTADRLRRIAEEGFAGAAVDLGAPEAPSAAELRPLLADFGLRCRVLAFVAPDRPIAEALDYATAVGAESLTVCGQHFPPDVPEAARLVRGWMAQSAFRGLPLELETHRYTLTNDLGFTTRLLDAVPELALSADLSHYVVGNELPDPGRPDPRAEELVDRVLRRSASFQGRVATRGQVQVPLDFPQHRAQVERFRTWWRTGFRYWRERAAADSAAGSGPGECAFLCELGNVPYAITGSDGRELSDRWAEAIRLKQWAEELFAAPTPPTAAPLETAR